MKAVVLDKQGRKIDSLKGIVRDGMFIYKKGGFLGFGAKKEQEECDYDNLVPVYWSTLFGLLKGSEKVIYYEYKNSRLSQLSWNQAVKTSVFADANNAWKQMTYAEEATLKRPTSGVENLVPWLVILVMIASVVGITVVSNNTNNQTTKAFTPLANMSAIQQKEINYLITQQNMTDRVMNATIRLLTYYISGTPNRTIP